jgi:ATP-dependent DNA ligase
MHFVILGLRGFEKAPVYEHRLEGVVADRRSGRYLPGERGWVK